MTKRIYVVLAMLILNASSQPVQISASVSTPSLNSVSVNLPSNVENVKVSTTVSVVNDASIVTATTESTTTTVPASTTTTPPSPPPTTTTTTAATSASTITKTEEMTTTAPIDCEKLSWKPCNFKKKDIECGIAEHCIQKFECKELGLLNLAHCFPIDTSGLVAAA